MKKAKIAIVTGGSSGIGRCAAISLSDAGCIVYEFSRRNLPMENIRHISVDITDETSVIDAVQQVKEEQGRVDILINCAGSGISGAIEFTELSEAKHQFNVNFFGTVNVTKAVLPLMREQGSGRIVNVSSVAAVAHIPFQAFYSASKAAIDSYTCSLANEVKPFGISVTSIQPGDIRTGFTQSRRKNPYGDDVYEGRISRSISRMEQDEQNGMKPETAGKYIAKIALKKHVKPIYAIGFVYKLLGVLCKLLPNGLRNYIVGLLYAK